jgi:hypothetical protein
MDHSAWLETQGNSAPYRRWRTCGDGGRTAPPNSLAFRPPQRDARHDRAARGIKENRAYDQIPGDGQNSFPALPRMLDHRMDGWRVCWLGGWDKQRVFFVVMLVRVKH